VWQVIGVPAGLERSLISKRTRAGVRAAQRRGIKFGRKPSLTPDQINDARNLVDKGEARQYVANLLNVGSLDTLAGAELLNTLPFFGGVRQDPSI
jgi:DNA invertase Pin-like site-specific DNA recombinase